MATVGIIVLPILVISILITIFVVIFVYKDATKRNMNALVWALVAALAPLFLGLILYLVCRNPLMDLQCPKCGAGIAQYEKKCPQCGSEFLTQCPQCDFPVQKGWTTCPSCGTSLPEDYGQPVRTYKKDNSIVPLIIVVVLVLFTLIFAVFTVNRVYVGKGDYEGGVGYAGFEGMYNITAEDMAGNSEIVDWLAGCKEEPDKVQVLLSTKSDTCLVYVKDSKKHMRSDVTVDYHGGKCNAYIYIEEYDYEDNYGYDFLLYEMEIKEDTDVEVYINGHLVDCRVVTTEANISMSTWGGQNNE